MPDKNKDTPRHIITAPKAAQLNEIECATLKQKISSALNAELILRGADAEKLLYSAISLEQKERGLEVVISGGLKPFLERQLPNGSFVETKDIDDSDAILISGADQEYLLALINPVLGEARRVSPIPRLVVPPSNELQF
jgi:hypothetical protein